MQKAISQVNIWNILLIEIMEGEVGTELLAHLRDRELSSNKTLGPVKQGFGNRGQPDVGGLKIGHGRSIRTIKTNSLIL